MTNDEAKAKSLIIELAGTSLTPEEIADFVDRRYPGEVSHRSIAPAVEYVREVSAARAAKQRECDIATVKALIEQLPGVLARLEAEAKPA